MNRWLKISFAAIGLILFGLLGSAVFVASTDTANKLTVEEIDARIAEINVELANLDKKNESPVEHKVIELRMTKKAVSLMPEKTRRGKRGKLPFPEHSTCSGAFINGNGDILTAKHCVEGDDELEVLTYDQRRYKAIVVASSTVHDLAIIHIDRRDTPYFELATTVTRGETVFILGSPLGITDVLSTGIVGRIDGDLMYVDCSALPGNSGSTVYNKDKKLVGLLNAGMIVLFGTTHLNVTQGLDAVYFFLKSVKEKQDGRK